MKILTSIAIFILAGFFEIGGGYLIWLWLKDGKSVWVGVLGSISLILYGIVATWQPTTFGRVYAAYGGIFITMAILWGWKIDNIAPDMYDIIGGIIALLGMSVMMYAPRT